MVLSKQSGLTGQLEGLFVARPHFTVLADHRIKGGGGTDLTDIVANQLCVVIVEKLTLSLTHVQDRRMVTWLSFSIFWRYSL